MSWHMGRSWVGHPLEDECPCPKTACGLVDLQHVDESCEQHPLDRAKTMRQGHPPADCPGSEKFD